MTQPQPGQWAGRILLVLAWVAGLWLASRFFADWEAKRHNPNTEPLSQQTATLNEVLLKANPQGHFLASGRINGQPVVFLLDTGATDVAIPAALARSLQLLPGASQGISTANGTVTGQRTHIDRLTLGPIILKDVRGVLVPDLQGSRILLGMSALKQLEFTQRDGTLVLRQPISEQHD